MIFVVMLGENRSFADAKRGFSATQNSEKTNKTSILFIGTSLVVFCHIRPEFNRISIDIRYYPVLIHCFNRIAIIIKLNDIMISICFQRIVHNNPFGSPSLSKKMSIVIRGTLREVVIFVRYKHLSVKYIVQVQLPLISSFDVLRSCLTLFSAPPSPQIQYENTSCAIPTDSFASLP